MNAKPYPKYKPSGVEWLGDVPEHWISIQMKWLARRYAGGTPDRNNSAYWDDGDIPWINSGAVNQQLVSEPSEFITREGYANSSARYVPKNALVMALAGQGKTKGMVAQVAFATTCNQSMAAIVPNMLSVPRYLYWLLDSQYQQIRNMAGGEQRDGLNLEILGSIPVFRFPRLEQQAIADFLDDRTAKIAAVLERKRALTGKFKEKRSTLISRTVTKGLPPEAAAQAGINPKSKLKHSGIEWLGDIPEHWEVWKHSHLFNSSMGQTILKEEVLDTGALPVLSATETYTIFGYLDTAAVILNKGDFVIPARGNSIGHVKLVRERCTTTQTTIYSKKLNKEVHSEYAYYYLLGNRDTLFHFDRTAIPQLTVGQVQSNPFLLPPLSEQVTIAAYLDRETAKIDRMIQKVETAIEKLTEYRTALITAAVTGKIDVREVA